MNTRVVRRRRVAFTGYFTREAPLKVASTEDRILTVIWSTGAAVDRINPFTGDIFQEQLEVSQRAVDLSFLNSGAGPLLDSHNARGTENVIGVIENAWIDKHKALARIRFPEPGISARADQVWAMAESGILQNWSVGYDIQEVKVSEGENGTQILTATRWKPREISVVAIPADEGAKTLGREAGTLPTSRKETNMPKSNRASLKPAPREVDDDDIEEGETLTRSANTGADDDTVLSITQVREIRKRAKAFGLSDSDALDIAEKAKSVREATDLLQNRAADRSPPPQGPRVEGGGGGLANPENFRAAAAEALFCRHNPRHKPGDQAQGFVGSSILDIARQCVERSGQRLPYMRTPGAILERAHSTSDFTAILSDLANKTLRAGYVQVNTGLRRVAMERTHRDFKARSQLLLDGSTLKLEKVLEGGEFKHGTMEELKTSYSLATYGKIFGITRQALVNDDLGAFDSMGKKLGQAAAAFEADELVRVLTQNAGLGPTFEDSKTIFHADHGNLAPAGSDLDLSGLDAARRSMRKQTGLGDAIVSVTPRFIVVSADNETAAEKAVAEVQATKSSDVNPFSKLEVLVEPRLSGPRWYLVADPAEIDGLSYAYLEGEPGPQVFTREGFDVDGTEFKVRLDFGCGFDDFRGWYTNAGE